MAVVDDLIIITSFVESWTNSSTLDLMRESLALTKDHPATLTLIDHRGEFHNSAQRKIMHDEMVRRRIPLDSPVALVTKSPMLRAAMMAWVWLTGTKASAYNDATTALAWLHSHREFDFERASAEYDACIAFLESRVTRAAV